MIWILMDGFLALREEEVPLSNVPPEFVFFNKASNPFLELQLGHQMWRKRGYVLLFTLLDARGEKKR
jgi:hypothetical protein